jgi:hypothetical protein
VVCQKCARPLALNRALRPTLRCYTNDEPGVPRERLIVRHPEVEEPALRMRTALDEAPIVALSDYHLSIAAGPRNPWA